MKKKVLTAILPVCVAMAMTACGGKADTAEVKDTAATEESAEADAQAEAEAEAKAREEAEEQARLEEAAECYEAGRKSLYGLDGAQIDLEDACTNFTKAQELGNTDANFYLGVLADWYSYPEQDFEQAKEYYEQCGDNPYAQISLGFLYYYFQVEWDGENWNDVPKMFQSAVDQGIADGYVGLAAVARDEQDYKTALEYYQKAAEEGTEQLYIVTAMTSIAYMYRYGDGVEQDGNAALEWYTKAADLGDTGAMKNIAYMYRYGDGVEQDGNAALEWYTKAADLGDTDAMIFIAIMYRNGDGVEQDGNAAIEWFQKAADLGDADAMDYIGVMYHGGVGVAQDYDAALEWYTKAADLGQTQAMCNIAWMYRAGSGAAQDGSAAIEWYTKAADLDDTDAMGEIGDMYQYGDGVGQDGDKALEWYMKSLALLPDYDVFKKMADVLHGEDALLKWFEESGDAEKMFALAEMYRSRYSDNGIQVLPDYDKAVEWYTKAADLGSLDAMKMLGFIYEYAPLYEREQDIDKAVEWYQKAADSGDEEAKERLEALQGQ